MSTRNFFLLFIAFLLGLWFFGSRLSSSSKITDTWPRPNDPWVFRSVLDTQARMITLALHDDLWASYSTERCALYKVWKGGVNFEGTVWNMAHGPQPTTLGDVWFENNHPQPWRVSVGGGAAQTATADYKGHRLTHGGVELFFDLVTPDGKRVRVNERPEFRKKNGQPGFERTFRLENAPEGTSVTFLTNVGSVVATSNIETNGQLDWAKKAARSVDGRDLLEADGSLTLNPKGETQLSAWFVAAPTYPNRFKVVNESETEGEISAGERLINKSDCKTCHNAEVQTVGPSYVAISNKYKNTPGNSLRLAQKIQKGGAGVWGAAAMSAHPDLSESDAQTMVSYILGLDEGDDDGSDTESRNLASIPESAWQKADANTPEQDLVPGLRTKMWQLNSAPDVMADINFSTKAAWEGKIANLYVADMDFNPFVDNFAMEMEGYLYVEKDDNALFQLASDDGSIFWLDGKELINHDGRHGASTKEAEVALRKGFHPIKIRFFQGGGGRQFILKWARSSNPEMQVITNGNLTFSKKDLSPDAPLLGGGSKIPGDKYPLQTVHPSFDLTQARPDDFLPKVAGMDFLSDGRLVVSTWDPTGGVYILENVQSGDPKKIKVKLIASGLAEPLGLKVVNDTIYVLQKQELTRLIDLNGDEVADEYQCFAKGWRASANFHEFAFGLAYKDGHFYAALAIAILPGGASARPQIPDRGKIVKISKADGSIEFIARGLRTPNTVGMGVDGELFVADNQGDWLPSCKILHIKPGAFYNSYAVDSLAVAGLPVQQPVVWLPQDEVGNSASQPSYINVGPYKGQMIHGEVTNGGVKRVFVEKINGEYQGVVFRFIQGLEAGINRLVWGPDSCLYVGGIGNPGNWGQTGKLWYGLQRLKYNGKSTFEMLAVRAKTNGLEVEFTEPLEAGIGWNPQDYSIQQWYYKPTIDYGGPKMDLRDLTVKSASVSSDRKRVFLEIEGMKPGHVVYLHLNRHWISEMSNQILSTEAWYTMNNIPAGTLGSVLPVPATAQAVADNTLSAEETAKGWKLLFDGKTLNGWRNYRKETIGSGWVVDQGAIHLKATKSPDGNWQSKDGGDILYGPEEFDNFEIKLDWKIGQCGNSGMIYAVQETDKYDYVWQTGPEMQVLDNSCHPDSKFPKHRAGDLYDLIECRYETVKPSGEWNHARLVVRNGRVEHWLNNRKVVEYDWNSKTFRDLVAGSKFASMPGFAKRLQGRFSLQDHGDPVWYKNIKVRKLN